MSIFPKVSALPEKVKTQLKPDLHFDSELARDYDLSWQALQKGYIGTAETYTAFQKLPVKDEYRFIRKYFNGTWATYVLLLRLLGFKNPFKEIAGWSATKKIKRSDYLKTPLSYPTWENFDSTLVKEKPLVSVVIPTLNRYKYLKDVLTDLENQDYKNFEVIVVDQSEPFQKDFYDQFELDLNLIHQKEKALWLARNTAIQKSKGDYILLFDDDSRIDIDWITNHLKCLDFFKADISSGVSISTQGAEIPENYAFFRISDQLDTGNVLLKKSIFKTTDLFDRQFEKQRMGDGEFGLRAYLQGFLNISNPKAKRLHLKVGSGGLREMGSWDGFRPKKWFAPRPIPSVLYLFRKYHGNQQSRYALLKTIPPSVMPYRFKKNKKMLVFGAIISVFLSPIIFIQVCISWHRSSKKLKQGPLRGKL